MANFVNGDGLDGLMKLERALNRNNQPVIIFMLPWTNTANYVIELNGLTDLAEAMAEGDFEKCKRVWYLDSTWHNGRVPDPSCSTTFARTQHIKINNGIVWGPKGISGVFKIPANLTLQDNANLRAAGAAIQQNLRLLNQE